MIKIYKHLIQMFYLFIKCFTEKYFQFKGRASRKEYLSFLIFNFVVIFSINITSFTVIYHIITVIYHIIALVPSISLTVRRLHDINLSGWWWCIVLTIVFLAGLLAGLLHTTTTGDIIVIVLVIIVIFFGLFFVCKKGTQGSNRYGEPPID